MSITISQTPSSASLAQSPIIFSVNETPTGSLLSSSFQYVAELTYWTGSVSASGSADYTLTKFANTSKYGIFDFSKIINSTLTEKLQENSSNVVYFKGDFYTQYILSGSTQFTTGSHTLSGVYKAIDGYGIFPENITSSLDSKTPFFPFLTDGPQSQSIYNTDFGRMGVWVGDIGISNPISHIRYNDLNETEYIAVTSSTDTSGQIQSIPIGYGETDFPLNVTNIGSSYNICPVSSSVSSSIVETQTTVSASFQTLPVVGGSPSMDYNEPTLLTNAQTFESFFNTVSPIYAWAADGASLYFASGSGQFPYAELRGSTPISGITVALDNTDFWKINAPFDGQVLDIVFSNSSERIDNRFTSSSFSTVNTNVYAEVGECLNFAVVCETKYPNVRVKWKNRFGQWDNFNFNMVSRESFSTTNRTYQPQLGSWDGTSLSYNNYDSSIENYVSDSSQTIQVNTDWIEEDYNDIFKQLLVSDEIYWIQNDGSSKPLSITTSNLQFKTGVVDKLIRYTFDFALGQNFKLIL